MTAPVLSSPAFVPDPDAVAYYARKLRAARAARRVHRMHWIGKGHTHCGEFVQPRAADQPAPTILCETCPAAEQAALAAHIDACEPCFREVSNTCWTVRDGVRAVSADLAAVVVTACYRGGM